MAGICAGRIGGLNAVIYALTICWLAVICYAIAEFEAAMLDAARLLVFPG